VKLPLVLTPGEDGWIVAECPVIPGCISQGRTREEALANIREAILPVVSGAACIQALERLGYRVVRTRGSDARLNPCELGKISTIAAATLRDMGFASAIAVDGGIKAWREAGYPLETGRPSTGASRG